MSLETSQPPRVGCRLRKIRVRGGDGAFDLAHVQHDARRFAPHFYATHAVGVVEAGSCRVKTPRGSWVAGPGSLLAFAPGGAHAAQVISDEPYAYRMAYLSAESMRGLGVRVGGDGGGTSCGLTPVLDPSPLSSRFVAAHRDVLDDPGSDRAATALLACARTLLGAATIPDAPRGSPRDHTVAETAQVILAAYMGHRVRLDHVAESCGVTSFHLMRVFRRVTGFSPYAWLMVLRVNEARRLLDAGAPVSDAVHACGFSDQSHLTRIFRRTLGVPPGQYLRAAR